MEIKKDKDRRIGLTTWQTLVIGGIITVFAVVFSYTTAWGLHIDHMEEAASAKIFQGKEYATVQGDTFSTADLKNTTVTAVNVWATTCHGCIEEMPALEAVSNSYDQSQFRIISIPDDVTDADGNVKSAELETAKQIITEKGVTFPSLILDKESYSFIKANVSSTPTTFFVDSSGNIIDTRLGDNTYDGWKSDIDAILASVQQQD